MKKLFILIGLAAAACSGGARDSVTLSARMASADGQPLPAANGAAEVAPGIELTRARIIVRHLRVEREDEPSELEISTGPLLVDVSGDALSGGLLELVNANVPPGAFDELKVEIEPIEAAPTAAFADLVTRGASVLLEGTVDGRPFAFAARLEVEVEHEGQFELGTAASNITLNIDASKWFKAADGSRLSPLDGAAHDAIVANIRASFKAFDDDDEDGIEDEREHHDGGDDHGGEGGGGHH